MPAETAIHTPTDAAPAPATDVKIIDNAVFGNWVQAGWPPGTDIVIIGTCTGPNGIVPRRLVLPHQVYVETLQEMAAEFDARDIVLIPGKAADYLMLPRAAVDAMRAWS
jgi:hypothetical protein